MHPVLLLIILVVAVLVVRRIRELPPAERARAGFKAALAAGALVLLVAAMTGRLSVLTGMIAAAIPLLQRVMTARSLIERFRSAATGRDGGRRQRIATPFLDMTLDPRTGDLRGSVRQGTHAGHALADLSLPQLLALLEEYARTDARSATLLGEYLERHHGAAWRAAGAGDAAANPMTRHEASQILGVPETASRDEVVDAHRKLIQRLHPDRGGSSYLASKINLAKDLLLAKR